MIVEVNVFLRPPWVTLKMEDGVNYAFAAQQSLNRVDMYRLPGLKSIYTCITAFKICRAVLSTSELQNLMFCIVFAIPTQLHVLHHSN